MGFSKREFTYIRDLEQQQENYEQRREQGDRALSLDKDNHL